MIAAAAAHPAGAPADGPKSGSVVSALLMLRRLLAALRIALREEDFGRVLGAALVLVAIGTVAYALGEGWNAVDALYFAVATLTTSSIADPELVITERWLKVFTSAYILVGIGILVEVARRLGMAFIAAREEQRRPRDRTGAGA